MSKTNRLVSLTSNVDAVKDLFTQGQIAEWLMSETAVQRSVWELTPTEMSWLLGVTKETVKRWFKDNKIETEYSEFHKTNVATNLTFGKFLLDNPKYELVLVGRVMSTIDVRTEFIKGDPEWNLNQIIDYIIQAEISLKENIYDWDKWVYNYWYKKADKVTEEKFGNG